MTRAGRAALVLAAAVSAALALLSALAPAGPDIAPAGPDIAADRPLSRPLPAGEGPLTLVFLGTSLTAGYDWPESLAERLQACLGRPVRAVTVARGGATSAWGRGQVPAVLAAAPDLVVIEFAANDADIRRLVPLGQSRRDHEAIIAALRAGRPGTAILLMTTNPATGLRRLLRPRLAAHYALYRDLAAVADTGLADLAPRWRAPGAPAQGGDGIHPDPAAAAAVIVPVLTDLIVRAAGVPGVPGMPGAACPP